MGIPIVVRRATEEAHLLEIQRLAHVIWREHYPGIISHEQIEYMLDRKYSLDALRADRDERGIQHDLAWAQSNAVGYAAYGPLAETGKPKLFSLYVRSDHRGLGCGAALLDRAIRWAQAR